MWSAEEEIVYNDALTPEEMLQALFDLNHFANKKGMAFLGVTYTDKDGRRFGSSCCVLERDLEGRGYTVDLYDGCHIGITFTDVVWTRAIFNKGGVASTWKAYNKLRLT
jgi:hypothetical protein